MTKLMGILFISVLLGPELYAQGRLRVLTFNAYRKPEFLGLGGTHAARRIKHLCQVLRRSDYDVVLLQEVWLAKDRRNLEDCGYEYVLNIGTKDPRGIGRAASANREQNLESGLLILSRYPFIKSIRFNYGQSGQWWRVFSDGETLVSKSAYAALIKINDQSSIWFVNTHLAANYCNQYPRINCNSYEDVRASQLEELSVLVKSLDAPVILGGDFNMGPSLVSRDMAWMRFDDYFPGFRQASFDPIDDSTSSIRNNFNFYDMGKIDHLFGSRHFHVTDGATVYTQLMNIDNRSLHLSDHFGWESTFYFD